MKHEQPSTTEYQKLQAAWRKAAKLGELVIPCPTLSDARRLRFTLYNAVKGVRDLKTHDPELLDVIRSVSLMIRDNPVRLVMQHRSTTPTMLALDAVLDEEDLLGLPEAPSGVTEEELESQKRLQELLQQPAEMENTALHNPYFTPREQR